MKKIITNLNDFIKENLEKELIEFPEYWYHGTNKYFDKFSLDYLGENFEQSILGIYFTQYMKPLPYGSTAKEYAENAVIKNGGEAYIYKCKLNFKNPLLLESDGWYSSNVYIDKNRNDIKRWKDDKRNDCIISYNFDEYKEDLNYADFIAVTSNLDIIEIVDIIKL